MLAKIYQQISQVIMSVEFFLQYSPLEKRMKKDRTLCFVNRRS